MVSVSRRENRVLCVDRLVTRHVAHNGCSQWDRLWRAVRLSSVAALSFSACGNLRGCNLLLLLQWLLRCRRHRLEQSQRERERRVNCSIMSLLLLCYARCSTAFIDRSLFLIQLHPRVAMPRSHALSSLSRTLKPRLHDTTCCQPRCQTGCTTRLTTGWTNSCSFNTVVPVCGGMFVYTIQPVVKPVVQPVVVWQPVVSCKRGLNINIPAKRPENNGDRNWYARNAMATARAVSS